MRVINSFTSYSLKESYIYALLQKINKHGITEIDKHEAFILATIIMDELDLNCMALLCVVFDISIKVSDDVQIEITKLKENPVKDVDYKFLENPVIMASELAHLVYIDESLSIKDSSLYVYYNILTKMEVNRVLMVSVLLVLLILHSSAQ